MLAGAVLLQLPNVFGTLEKRWVVEPGNKAKPVSLTEEVHRWSFVTYVLHLGSSSRVLLLLLAQGLPSTNGDEVVMLWKGPRCNP